MEKTSTDTAKAMEISLQQIKTNFNGEYCYVHARGAVTPDGLAVITTQPLYLRGSDVFYGIEMLKSSDRGETWSNIRKSETLVRKDYDIDFERAFSDATPFYHKKSGKLLLTGHSVVYKKGEVLRHVRLSPRFTLWSVFDPEKGDWEDYRELEMPADDLFYNCGAGCSQILELPDGDLLVPVYTISKKEFSEPDYTYKALVTRCSFDGSSLTVKEIGSALSVDIPRGLGEPSVATVGGEYFLALRNDQKGYVSKSQDGLNYTDPKVLCFDDGEESGNYCTQQHWITGGGKLYMVYTRRGAGNDHVFRHRAPLFIAEFDTENLCLIRHTEQIVVPERGARLGNFGCTQISENEAWVIAAEWMQTTAPDPTDYKRCMSYGSDNSIWIAKIKFS